MQPGNFSALLGIHSILLLHLRHGIEAVIVDATSSPLRFISNRGPHGRNLLYLLALLCVHTLARHKFIVIEHGWALTHGRYVLEILRRLVLS